MVAFAEIEAVLFDMGGTLIDYPVPSRPVVVGRFLKGFVAGILLGDESRFPPAASVPRPEDAPSHRARARPDTPLPYRITMALRRVVRSVSGRTLPTLGEMGARPLMAEGRLVPDARSILQALRRRGYRLGLVSNTPWGTPDYLWRGQLERFHLDEFFEVACFSSDVGFRKPDARIFRTALDGLGVLPRRAVFVGDEPKADIAGARAAGLRSVWVDRADLASVAGPGTCPDLRVTTLSALLDHLPGRQ